MRSQPIVSSAAERRDRGREGEKGERRVREREGAMAMVMVPVSR
jgi:hypothetical protein